MDPEHHEEIARSLFRESNDACFYFDPEHNRVLDLNPVAQRLTGFSRDQARSLGVWDLFSGDIPGALDRLVEAYHQTGFYHSREGFYLSRKDGPAIPVNVSVSRMHTRPKPIGLVVARDVTERKRSEAALIDSEARFRRLIETAPVIFWTVDAHGLITSLNPEFQLITGHDAEEWLGLPLEALVLPEDRPACKMLLDYDRSAGHCVPVELRVDTRWGHPVILEFETACPQELDRSDGLSGIARNVTQARLAEKLERDKAAAELADRAKSAFLAHFSHEIRTPLTSILGFTEILLGDVEVARLPKERLEDLMIIRQSGSHLLAIINDILDLSQIESGKLSVERRACSPSALAGEVLDALRRNASDRGLALVMRQIGPQPASILTDPVRFRQIVMNLVSNAIKFTHRGEVEVSLQSSTTSLGPSLVVEVTDTGIGLSREQQAQLFEPFYQGSQVDTVGTGLGLAISRRLAECLGGTLTAESQLGQGSTFRLVLPIGPIPEGRDPGNIPTSLHTQAQPLPELEWKPLPGRILLAEDNASIQRVIAFHLEKAGARVNLAKNGQEAIDQASEAMLEGEPFDVILMDMQMPVLDGYEATRQLRDLGIRSRIIAITAYAMAEDRQECLNFGCDDHMSKPIDWIQLNHRIAEYLAERAGQRPKAPPSFAERELTQASAQRPEDS